MLYRIQTEDINRPDIIKIVGEFFDGFTIIPAIGYYRGIQENSITIEIIAVNSDMVQNQIKAIAAAIRILNKQECVLISEINELSEFVR
jgi:hypothetical protein